jgi:hypothetical protein
VTYGCKDRATYLSSIPVADGYFMDGYTRAPRMVPMPFRMAQGCEYTKSELGQADTRCTGCTHKSTQEKQ